MERGGRGECERNGSRRSRRHVGWNRGWKGRARVVERSGERRERGSPRAPRGRGSFIPGSRLPTSSRVSPSLATRQRAIYHRLRPTLLPHVPVPLVPLSSFIRRRRIPYFVYLVPLLLPLLQPPSILFPFSFVAPSRGSLPGSPLVNPRRKLGREGTSCCFFRAGVESDFSVTLIPGIVDFSN